MERGWEKREVTQKQKAIVGGLIGYDKGAAGNGQVVERLWQGCVGKVLPFQVRNMAFGFIPGSKDL